MCIIAPSLLEADYKCLGEQLKTMEKSGAEYVHIDVWMEALYRIWHVE